MDIVAGKSGIQIDGRFCDAELGSDGSCLTRIPPHDRPHDRIRDRFQAGKMVLGNESRTDESDPDRGHVRPSSGHRA
jgi:hypothetical protein